jgi:hypothetical protein
MGILIEANNGDIDDPLAWDRYNSYLAGIGERLPVAAREFAEAPWHYDPKDHRCPHDAWVENVLISEPAQGTRRERRRIDIQVRLLGAYHDGHLTIRYLNVAAYRLDQPNRPEDQENRRWVGHGDWLIDEVGLSKEGFMTHEVSFRWGGTWYIECEDFSYEWQSGGYDPESLDSGSV